MVNSLLLSILVMSLLEINAGLVIEPFPNNVIRGINYYFGDNTSMTAPTTFQSVKYQAKQAGANLLALSYQICQANPSSNYVFRDPSITPSNETISSLVNYASEQGMQSFLKPLIVQNASDSSFNFDNVNPSNITLWFESYSNVMMEFAQLAASLNGAVSVICVGLELLQVSPYASHWITLIQTMRTVYSGKLSYCSDTLSGETEAITFWNELDYIGLDIYVPLVNPFATDPNLQPTFESMQSEFQYIWTLGFFNWFQNSTFYNKIPLFITETGYPSSNGGLLTPYMIPSKSSGGCSGMYAPNETAQYAALQVLGTELPQFMTETSGNLAGVVYFNFDDCSNSWYEYKINSTFECSWSPVNKTGYAVLTDMFAPAVDSDNSSGDSGGSRLSSSAIAGLLVVVLVVVWSVYVGISCISNKK